MLQAECGQYCFPRAAHSGDVELKREPKKDLSCIILHNSNIINSICRPNDTMWEKTIVRIVLYLFLDEYVFDSIQLVLWYVMTFVKLITHFSSIFNSFYYPFCCVCPKIIDFLVCKLCFFTSQIDIQEVGDVGGWGWII